VRQSSGALHEDEMSARFPHELLCASDNMNRYSDYFTGRDARLTIQWNAPGNWSSIFSLAVNVTTATCPVYGSYNRSADAIQTGLLPLNWTEKCLISPEKLGFKIFFTQPS
jgi:hypothetical protein